MVTAELKNYRQSARKVRIVADSVRGKEVLKAIDLLAFTIKRSADPLKKLLESAVANAEHNHGLKAENLFVKEIRVDEGITLHRFRAGARGRAAPIRKRTCRIKVVLDVLEGVISTEVAKEAPKAPKKTTKKAPASNAAKVATKKAAKKAVKKPATKKAAPKKAAKTAKKTSSNAVKKTKK